MVTFLEFLNETKKSSQLTEIDEFFNLVCESSQLDEGFKDTLKNQDIDKNKKFDAKIMIRAVKQAAMARKISDNDKKIAALSYLAAPLIYFNKRYKKNSYIHFFLKFTDSICKTQL